MGAAALIGRHGAWRFTFRGLAQQGFPAGVTVSPKGGIELVTEGETVRQAILLLIATRPGERVMRPDYGCHLFRLTFSPNDDTTAGLAIHYVRQALTKWEPRIDIVRLDATRNSDHPSRLNMQLQYRLRSRGNVDQVELGFDLQTGAIQH